MFVYSKYWATGFRKSQTSKSDLVAETKSDSLNLKIPVQTFFHIYLIEEKNPIKSKTSNIQNQNYFI